MAQIDGFGFADQSLQRVSGCFRFGLHDVCDRIDQFLQHLVHLCLCRLSTKQLFCFTQCLQCCFRAFCVITFQIHCFGSIDHCFQVLRIRMNLYFKLVEASHDTRSIECRFRRKCVTCLFQGSEAFGSIRISELIDDGAHRINDEILACLQASAGILRAHQTLHDRSESRVDRNRGIVIINGRLCIAYGRQDLIQI